MTAFSRGRPGTPPVERDPMPGSPPRGRVAFLAGVRTRILLSFLVLLIISTTASVLVLRQVLLSRIGDQAERSLTVKIDAFSALSNSGRNPSTGKPFNGRLQPLFASYLSHDAPVDMGTLVAYVDGRRVRQRSLNVGSSGLVSALSGLGSITQPQSGQVSTDEGPARYAAIPVSSGSGQHGVLVAAALLGDERQQVEDAVRIASGVSVVVLLLASLFIWLAAGRAVAPLKELAGTAYKITETDISRRLSVRGNDEIAQLGRTFNDMLDRLDFAFTSQRAFMADVSHELRTPITVIRGHLETLGDDPAERREAMAVVSDELDRMSRLVDDLLVLARASRPDFLRVEPLDLDLLTHDLFGKARRLDDRDWHLDDAGAGVVRADPHRLTQAVMNLAENAARHTGAGDRVSLGSSLHGSEARLWVKDSGPGVDPADRERIFERFASGSDGGGAGLGLAIVRAIAEAHGGRVELESEVGRGATFTIVIPAEPTGAGPR